MKIGILTSGGDCPGLNAVIRGAVLKGGRAYDSAYTCSNSTAACYTTRYGTCTSHTASRRYSCVQYSCKQFAKTGVIW